MRARGVILRLQLVHGVLGGPPALAHLEENLALTSSAVIHTLPGDWGLERFSITGIHQTRKKTKSGLSGKHPTVEHEG